ncbi:RNA polymerase sigma factor FliA [Beggiatoa alba]|nr:RNA polymerase sigma factor FliA [Beggiatoa alba]
MQPIKIHEKIKADRLVEDYSDLVKRIAYNLIVRLPSSVIVDDLIQSGLLGLLDAAEHYDASQGAAFETYATIRVRGAMLDELRRNDWAPKSVHKKARDVMAAVQKIENATGRDARNNEVAKELNLSISEYHQILQETNSCRILNFGDLGVDDDCAMNNTSKKMTPLDGMQSQEFKAQLVDAIRHLPDREALVISLYYDEEMNLREIGCVLDVSESRISQLLSQAHLRMRSYLMQLEEEEVDN